ncbi:MAG: class I SAM-dependent methyltransferase [Thermodesulfobacteriota bacterium]
MKSKVDLWNAVTKERQAEKKAPQEEVAALHDLFRNEKVKKILDLGCGSGRHLVFFAKQGYDVCGIDVSPEAISLSRKWLAEEGLAAELHCKDIERLPWPDNYFDAVISVQVIEHNRLEPVRKIIREVNRVVHPAGYFFVVVKKFPPAKDWKKGKFVRLDHHLYAPTEGTEKGIVHYFFAEDELKDVFSGFDIVDVKADKKSEHYCVLSQKPD